MKTCGKGHEYTTLKCGVCASLRSKKHYEANKEKVAAQAKINYAANKEKRLAQGAVWREANKDKVAKNRKAWVKKNPAKIAAVQKKNHLKHKEKYDSVQVSWREANREYLSTATKNWQKNNPEKAAALNAKRRAAKLQQTPPWYNHADAVAIYKELKPGYHIDHIIPLQGKNVSGLHWHHNLQLLPAAENISKSNSFNPDTYVHELPLY